VDKFKSIKKQLETTAYNENIEINYSGFYTEKQTLYNEFIQVMIVSITLLFLILAAQFESIVLPTIILFEVIFDIFGALLFLLLFKSDINIMSGLGILIMSGIVINDSIIKISAIDKEYRSGKKLIDAIKIGGHKRFNSIIMTSLTTILSMIPFIFFKGIGSELQTPLSIAIIGGLTIGTLVSLYFIPIAYYFIRKSRLLNNI
jgi:multidrug efflux pump subunit AcrB